MKDYLLSTLENSRNYTIAVADAMPEKNFNSPVAKGSMNFGELLNHLAYGITWWNNNYIKNEKDDWNPPTGESKKQVILERVNQSYDILKNTIEETTISNQVVQGFQATLDHITHHRGQAVLHLRYYGITPPDYIF